ncbi:hypothetical protein ElyMa_003993100 [Elysia marginata]|uniref:Uncharacterized protein n=1 Tax=Elysia marginata TaxID=1093978 RepID=A0AAV4FZZ1_9GAST|nr:hypothetical protein ElyMa_003993100 [Elysia marginata]
MTKRLKNTISCTRKDSQRKSTTALPQSHSQPANLCLNDKPSPKFPQPLVPGSNRDSSSPTAKAQVKAGKRNQTAKSNTFPAPHRFDQYCEVQMALPGEAE